VEGVGLMAFSAIVDPSERLSGTAEAAKNVCLFSSTDGACRTQHWRSTKYVGGKCGNCKTVSANELYCKIISHNSCNGYYFHVPNAESCRIQDAPRLCDLSAGSLRVSMLCYVLLAGPPEPPPGNEYGSNVLDRILSDARQHCWPGGT